MAQNVIQEHGIKGRCVKGKILGSVAQLETCLGSKPGRLCKLLRIANSGLIDVQPYELAAHLSRKMQSISAGTATDLQYGGIAAQIKQLRNFQRLLGCDPTGLAEVLAIGFDTHLSIGIRRIISVRIVVEIKHFPDTITKLTGERTMRAQDPEVNCEF